ncbi:putative receptor-like protein kinase At5g39000 [Salvia miltiorrhiza]|uniref:putative receptor-like protein kinase At5g39000 n=1 Tax=Salvia miltiorrhiza TaxID=226208 RepID=UPI0025ACD66D|nr:putative receptor-like protein kinase At5g39000 [Salvia miltiorrhiza]
MTRLSINCGSAATSAALNGREWIGDIRPKGSSLLQIKGSSTTSTVTHSSISADQAPHKTARISASQFSYAFRVSPGLTWKQRLDICIGTARGLDYLHTGNGLIHRDVKASNILMDENLVPKVSDFGLAKPEDRSKLQSHVSTKVKGTYGYLDPYYYSSRKLTRKSDAYAFGVVLLEVLCERRPMDPRFEEEYCLTRWAGNKISEGEVNQIVASSLLDEILPDSLKVYVEVAERCLHDEPKKRPTMAQILVQLEFVLQHHENGRIAEPNHVDMFPSNDMVSPANTEQSTEASSPTKQTNSNYFPARQDEWRETTHYKARFRALDTLWNRLKPSKRKELSLSSGICSFSNLLSIY